MREVEFILTTTDQDTIILDQSPSGWEEETITWERSLKYWGVFRSYTVPLKFITQGALLLREEFYTYGFQASAQLLVKKLDKRTLLYVDAFEGKLDFSTFKDDVDTVECTAISGKLDDILKKNESIEYTIPNFANFDEGGRDIYITPNVPYQARNVQGMKLVSLYKSLVHYLTDLHVKDGTYGYLSTLLEGLDTDIVVTAGYDWRVEATPPDSGGVFKTSIKDFYKSINAITPIGLGVETIDDVETLVLETREYFFDSTLTIATITDAISNLKLSVIKEMNHGVVRIGYPTKEYDEAGKPKEQNCEVFYKMPGTLSTSEYELLSKYRGDGYGLLQILDEGTDSNDDDIFFVEIYNPTPGNYVAPFGEVRHSYVPLTTWDNFNVAISPRRNLDNHRSFIESMQYGQVGEAVEFTKGDNSQQFAETKTFDLAAWVEEYTGFDIVDSNNYIQPIKIEFEAPYPFDIIALLNANPKGKIGFTYDGVTYYGYVMKMETTLIGRGSTKFSLISAAENDLTQLIRL